MHFVTFGTLYHGRIDGTVIILVYNLYFVRGRLQTILHEKNVIVTFYRGRAVSRETFSCWFRDKIKEKIHVNHALRTR